MRYSLRMINGNGYEIHRNFQSVEKAKTFARFYPLQSFFGYIYDTTSDEIKYQNNYTDRWNKCNNETFVPYHI